MAAACIAMRTMRVHGDRVASAAGLVHGRLAVVACLLLACIQPTATDPLPTATEPPVEPTAGLDDYGGVYLQEGALDGGGEGDEGSPAAMEVVIGVVVLAVAIAILAVSKHLLARHRETRIRGEIAKVVGDAADLQWDAGGMISSFAATTKIDAQLGSTEGRMTKYGKIDHLRGWHSSVSDAGDDEMPVQVESESGQVVICDLCEQMGNMMPAVQSCLDCGDVAMCQICLESTHLDKKKNKKLRHHKLVPIISVDREVNPNGVEVYGPETGGAADNIVAGLVSPTPEQVESYDRIPFRSEVPLLKKHYIESRHTAVDSPDTAVYDFFRREVAMVLAPQVSSDPKSPQSRPARRSSHNTPAPRTSDTVLEGLKVDTEAAVTNVQKFADNGENILDRVPGGLGMRLKDLPTRRQVLDIRKQAVNAERQVKREQVEKDHELRVSNVCAIKITITEVEGDQDDSDGERELFEQLDGQTDLDVLSSTDRNPKDRTGENIVEWLLDEMVSLTVALGEQQNDDLKEKIRAQHWKLARLESRRKQAYNMALESSRQALEVFAAEDGEVNLNSWATQEMIESAMDNQRRTSIRKMLATVGQATMGQQRKMAIPRMLTEEGDEAEDDAVNSEQPNYQTLHEGDHCLPPTCSTTLPESALPLSPSPTSPMSPRASFDTSMYSPMRSPLADILVDAAAAAASVAIKLASQSRRGTMRTSTSPRGESPGSPQSRRMSPMYESEYHSPVHVPSPCAVPVYGDVLAELATKLKGFKKDPTKRLSMALASDAYESDDDS